LFLKYTVVYKLDTTRAIVYLCIVHNVLKISPASNSPLRRDRDAGASRDAILAAAQLLFAERGYVQTGVRDIAAAANVNSALVGRYFGTKNQLFKVALETALDMSFLQRADRATAGKLVAILFSSAGNVPSPLRMMILSMADPEARLISIQLLESAVIIPLAEWLGEPDAIDRARQLNMLWSGFLTGLELADPESETRKRSDAALRWLEHATQAIVDLGR
jgi:AcrR family transcriptional regulator